MDKKSNDVSIISKQAGELKKAYYKQWRAENRDKVRDSQTRYWEKRAAEYLNSNVKEQ